MFSSLVQSMRDCAWGLIAVAVSIVAMALVSLRSC